ncbi:HotDog domain-containing protein [Boeremia exigua]|uniref:HotDog domain-containing protein n=1 Tax=Boeremia exigua TaxID=749465 RepID=UPI001E8DDB80|nr:HotDog domain-containing protein [Boeremia exigua]KAH6616581.1 HotDog domain-containing protein [Boeremia exigua]
MIQSDIAKLSTIPWAAELINDKRWTPTLSSNRFTKPTGEDSFFAETLDTGRTIRTMLTLRPTEDQEGEWMYKELLVILDLGDGLNGYAQILHGGFATTLLDETCGGLIQLNVFEKVRRFGSQHAMNYLTAYLNTVYKKPIPVPGPLLCTAKIERQDGRKLYVRATIEDGEGTIYATGDCMFIKAKPSL